MQHRQDAPAIASLPLLAVVGIITGATVILAAGVLSGNSLTSGLMLRARSNGSSVSGSNRNISSGSDVDASTAFGGTSTRRCASRTHLNGTFNARVPPYFVPQDCDLYNWTGPTSATCLGDRRIFIIGNSVQRHLAFEAAQWYGHSKVTRDQEKELCGSGMDAKTCTMRLGDASIHFVFSQPGILRPVDGMYHDYCGASDSAKQTGNESACYTEFLRESRPGDVLVHGPGMGLIWFEQMARRAVPDYAAYVREQLAAWRDMLAVAWHGRVQDVFRMRLHHIYGEERGEASWTDNVTPINSLMDETFAGTGWSIIDQEGINGRRRQYMSDHVHFPGKLLQG